MPTAESGVVIVGAGPTGLLLASELALAGVPCQVLERRDDPRADSRAICLHARSMEALDLRGQAASFADAGLAVPGFPLGPRGAKINFGVLDSDFPYMLDMPQSQIERLLLARALELGAEVRWSATVTAVSQDDDGATVALSDGTQVAGRLCRRLRRRAQLRPQRRRDSRSPALTTPARWCSPICGSTACPWTPPTATFPATECCWSSRSGTGPAGWSCTTMRAPRSRSPSPSTWPR